MVRCSSQEILHLILRAECQFMGANWKALLTTKLLHYKPSFITQETEGLVVQFSSPCGDIASIANFSNLLSTLKHEVAAYMCILPHLEALKRQLN